VLAGSLAILAVGAVGAYEYLANSPQQREYERQVNLPVMPVVVGYRPALLGAGLVAQIKNVSGRHLSLLTTLKNPTTGQQKVVRIDVAPGQVQEIGHLEGWTFASGDQITIAHNDYRPWAGSLP